MEANNEIAKNKHHELRAKLDTIVSDENAENWWKPELFEKNILPILPPELEIIKSVPNEERNYNCFVYVLGLHHYPEIIGNKGWEFTRNLGPLFDEMITNGSLHKVDKSSQGMVIVYRAENGNISHVGLMESEDTVVSKWSWGPLLKHHIFDVPAGYGNTVEFYILTPEAINFVLTKLNTDVS